MSKLARVSWLVAAALASLSCANPAGIVDDFFSADAMAQGRVSDLADKPLPGVNVGISVPSGGSPFPYVSDHATTDAEGHFRIAVHRVGSSVGAPRPDTLSALVVATASGPQYMELPGGGFPTDSSTVVLLTFAPRGVQGPVANVAVRLDVR